MIRLAAFSDEAGSPLSEQIAALQRNGISLVELRSADGKNVSSFTDAEAKEARKRLADAGIAVWAAGSPVGKEQISAPFGPYLDFVRRTLEITRMLGTTRLRAFSFYGACGAREQVFDRLNAIAEEAKAFGVRVFHENEKEIYGDVLARVEEIRAHVPGLKFVCDPANYIQCGETGENILRAAEFADYLHIKDVVRATGELVPAGEGDGRIADLIAVSEGKTLTVEPHLALFEGYSAADGTEMKNKYVFQSGAEAFDCACGALKNLLRRAGYRESGEGWVK